MRFIRQTTIRPKRLPYDLRFFYPFFTCLLGLTLCVGVGLLPGLYAQNTLPAVAFEAHELSSKDGHTKLVWNAAQEPTNGQWQFEVQFDSTETFSAPTTLYQGPDQATFISGLPNGSYHYRVRIVGPGEAPPGPWDRATLTVEHHALSLALTISGIGSLVFIFTVILVLRGVRNVRTAD